ncbi:MAG: hypothetical protein MPJ50_00455 [Pirellulales bacterium]|nr:hypothetical protein [Pirellulales bacterium]
MTDEQLITMLYESSPEDLSAAQLKELRTRMLASARVKQAVAHRVRLEQALTETLAPPHLQSAAIAAACTAAVVTVPIAGGLLGWFKGWSVTVWSGLAAMTVCVPVAVMVLMNDQPPKSTTEQPPPIESMIADAPGLPPGEDLAPLEESPSDRLPTGWVPMQSLGDPPEPSADVDNEDQGP